MAAFLKIVSGVYLLFLWFIFAAVIVGSGKTGTALAPEYGAIVQPIAFLLCVLLSIPAVALYAFGQVVGDVRAMREHLRATRAYYEPSRQ